ncbi:MAG TPA: DUF4293 domain-containing protein [Chitinophagales bacterium]|nr:DUF4293 domain-containing protein [Chitinophagales bacterium]
MIQRIQTVWWSLSAIFMGGCICLPLFELTETESARIIHANDVNYIYLPLIGQVILTFITIFLFKKRSLQIVLGYVIVLNLIAICIGVFVKYKLSIESHPELHILPWAAVFLLPIIFQILAIRAVKKDEALIRSMDRLR